MGRGAPRLEAPTLESRDHRRDRLAVARAISGARGPTWPCVHAMTVGLLTRDDAASSAGMRRRAPEAGSVDGADRGALQRPQARGKFLFAGSKKLWIRGVTYGTFRPDASGAQFPEPSVVDRDFTAMATAGLNSVRVYTVPPLWLLDLAASHGLRVMVGLPWEQHITFLDDRAGARRIVSDIRLAVRGCAGHPALLCYAV